MLTRTPDRVNATQARRRNGSLIGKPPSTASASSSSVIVFSVDADAFSPDRSCRDCPVPARERRARVPCWMGQLKLMHADIATLFSRLIEALHLNADSRIIHAMVLKVDALQPQNLAFWLRRA